MNPNDIKPPYYKVILSYVDENGKETFQAMKLTCGEISNIDAFTRYYLGPMKDLVDMEVKRSAT
jgi:hypothetical protein